MPHRNRVIVVDDKAEDGEAIIKCLWKLQIPSFFLHYDEELLVDIDESKKFLGIRFIFQDIALVSPDIPGHDDYGAAAAGIDKILSDENGPWLMVAWSTWGNDPDHGGKYAQELFDYLVARLPPGKRPYQFVVIDKTPYSANGMHDAVKTAFTVTERADLIASVNSVVKPMASLEALDHWEADVRSSASRVIHDLWDMINSGSLEELDKSLGGLLFQLAKAQEGTRIQTTDDLSSPLYQILSSLLYDKISHAKVQEIKISADVKRNVQANLINTMLHWESAGEGTRHSPGDIYMWPLDNDPDLGGLSISQENSREFIVDAFVDTTKKEKALADKEFSDNVGIVLLDITPACDHANNKAFWRRFLVGVKVCEKSRQYFFSKGKLPGDFLKETDEFLVNGSKFQFVFSSKLLVSLTDKNEYLSNRSESDQEDSNNYIPEVNKLKHVGRIREQMLQEFIAWFGRMATRPGIVSLR